MHNSPRPSLFSHSYTNITLHITSSVIHTLAPKAYIFPHISTRVVFTIQFKKHALIFYFFYLTTTFDK